MPAHTVARDHSMCESHNASMLRMMGHVCAQSGSAVRASERVQDELWRKDRAQNEGVTMAGSRASIRTRHTCAQERDGEQRSEHERARASWAITSNNGMRALRSECERVRVLARAVRTVRPGTPSSGRSRCPAMTTVPQQPSAGHRRFAQVPGVLARSPLYLHASANTSKYSLSPPVY